VEYHTVPDLSRQRRIKWVPRKIGPTTSVQMVKKKKKEMLNWNPLGDPGGAERRDFNSLLAQEKERRR